MARNWYWWLVLAFLLSAVVCGPFLSSPIFFDDNDFFQEKSLLRVVEQPYWSPRAWAYKSFVATYELFGPKLVWLRAGNYIFHFGVVLALFLFVRELVRDLDRRVGLHISADSAAALVALLFAVHPLAIFTQGYLIQRSILGATLFALLALLFFWRGMSGSRIALAASCIFTLLAIYAKEHAVMLPFGAIMLLVLRLRSELPTGMPLRNVFVAILVQCCISIFVVFQIAGVLGSSYEPLFSEMLDLTVNISKDQIYPLSIANQMALFFKYLLIWTVPVPAWVSVDVRTAFPLVFDVWVLLRMLAYLAYMLTALVLLFRGGAKGLLGFSLLLPGCLFFSEFAAVRLQEPFVVYRSYLWFPFILVALALILRRLRWRVLLSILVFALPLLVGLSYERLKTFSHPLLIWQEAADVYESKVSSGSSADGVFGGYRIFYNLGSELRQMGFLDSALNAFNRCLELKPGHVWGLVNRGAVYLDMKNYAAAKMDYERVLHVMADRPVAWNGMARALEGLGDHDEAKQAKLVACKISKEEDCGEILVEGMRLR